MYVQVAPAKRIRWGDIFVDAVASLQDKYGGEAHVVEDDGCYVILSRATDGSYYPASWIFPELFEVLRTLPNPDTLH